MVSGRIHGGLKVKVVKGACKWKESWWLKVEEVMVACMWKESWWLVCGRSHGGLYVEGVMVACMWKDHGGL